MNKQQKYILWFKELSKNDIPLVGGKNASLAEMINSLSPEGINVPDGFAFTTAAYWHFLKENRFQEKLEKIFSKFNPKSIKSLQQTGKRARNLILKGKFPLDLEKEILLAYERLEKKYGKNCQVAVRSSGVAEDQPLHSFAGQFETFLNVTGKEKLLEAIKKCLASSFNDRVIAYREEKRISHLEFALSIGVQKMVRSDLASSGVIFTLDTETGFPGVVLINSIWGVGEMIVQGKVTPDEFYVHKPTFKKGFKSIILKNLGRKTKKYIFKKSGSLKEVQVAERDQLRFSLTDKEILTLAKWALAIEEHYGVAQDIEWAKDGKTNQLFIVQSRPETVHTQRAKQIYYKEYKIKSSKPPILTGTAIGDKIGQGKVRIVPDVSRMGEFKKGEVLVTKMTDPDWLPVFPLASAIITEEGGATCFEGNTKILTNKGFLCIKEIVKRCQKEEIKTLSLNRKELKLEWKKIVKGLKRKASLIEVVVSQTGNVKRNVLKVTPDHRFLTFNNRKLASEPIGDLLKNKKGILSLQKIPTLNSLTNISPQVAYLLGAISTDGYVELKKTKGRMVFIQKPTKEKKEFIEKVKTYFLDEYKYQLHQTRRPFTEGIIRGRRIKGGATISLSCYKKVIVEDFLSKQKNLPLLILRAPKDFVLNFLAGVIDGDGSFREESKKFRTPPRIHIFCSNFTLFQAIIIGCLKLGINFQVSPNRNILNIQLVDNFQEILNHTARIKAKKDNNRLKEKRFFFARQLLEDIKCAVNQEGKILPYIEKNLIISSTVLQNYVLPKIKGTLANHQLTEVLGSPLKMLRVKKKKKLDGNREVYNITVEKNHNYVVFTDYLTPIVVENCHAAIVSRELGIPCIVGAKGAMSTFKNGQELTVDCTSGRKGKIFSGRIPYQVKKYNLKKIPKLKTKIMVNIGAPEIAFKTSFLPVDGVGLAREEFIVAEKIRVHPLALYHYKKLKAQSLKPKTTVQNLKSIIKQIEEITIEHKDKREFFVKELAEGMAQIAAAFYPKEVIVRLSDFKSNEYENLVGGQLFEKKEENPMMGFRGASRYLDKEFQPAFEMECQALKRARNIFGLKNISLMIPFCRTVEEGEKVLELMKKFGLEKGKDSLRVYIMCEIPSNVILAKEFLEVCDGYSIGTNDLAQFILGMDRDNAQIAHIANETHPAVKKMVSEVIKICNRMKKYSGICGDAPSTITEFAQFLLDCKIESISLSPDAVIKTILSLAKIRK